MTFPKRTIAPWASPPLLVVLLLLGCGSPIRKADRGAWLPTEREQRAMAARELDRLVDDLGREMTLDDPRRCHDGIVAQVEHSRGHAVLIAGDLKQFARVHLERRRDGSVGKVRYDVWDKDFRELFSAYLIPETQWKDLAEDFNATGSGTSQSNGRSFILTYDYATREWVYTLRGYPRRWGLPRIESPTGDPAATSP